MLYVIGAAELLSVISLVGWPNLKTIYFSSSADTAAGMVFGPCVSHCNVCFRLCRRGSVGSGSTDPGEQQTPPTDCGCTFTYSEQM